MADKLLRTFFGFELPRSVSHSVPGLRTIVDDPREAVRWVKGRNIHLTLKYLGPTPESIISKIEDKVRNGISGLSPISLTVKRTGVFPSPTRPRVLWLGITGDTDGIVNLEKTVDKIVEPMGFPSEKQEFTPHITIGRVRYPQKITPDVTKFLASKYEPVDIRLTEFHLYESRQGSDGLKYVSLATFPLLATDQEK